MCKVWRYGVTVLRWCNGAVSGISSWYEECRKSVCMCIVTSTQNISTPLGVYCMISPLRFWLGGSPDPRVEMAPPRMPPAAAAAIAAAPPCMTPCVFAL